MPKRKSGMTTEEQSEKFRAAVRELVAAGELNPTEAEYGVERVLRNAKTGGGKSDHPGRDETIP